MYEHPRLFGDPKNQGVFAQRHHACKLIVSMLEYGFYHLLAKFALGFRGSIRFLQLTDAKQGCQDIVS